MQEQAAGPGSPHWHSAVEAPERVAGPEAVQWDAETDFLVVGYGGAGASAAVAGAEAGLAVTALDLSAGGGSTAINGGIFYAGGGTAIQRQAGVEDSTEAMFRYLQGETQGVVSDATLRRFCDDSAATLDWLVQHGVKFDATYYKGKTSYPPPGYHLYHSDSSLAAARAAIAKPAARGHKVYTPPSRAAIGFGKGFTEPLAAAAAKLGVTFQPQSEVRRLIQDESGRVIGVAVLQFPAGSAERERYAHMQASAQRFATMLPPAFPGSGITFGLARWYDQRAKAFEGARVLRRIRAKKGVCLAAGGFVFNAGMVRHYAPKYADGMPLGQPGDNGSGIRLGQSVGGAVSRMGHFSAWRFIRPPAGLSWGAIVDRHGARFIDETVYGAMTGYEMIENHDGRAWIILDRALYQETLKQTKGKDLYSFQSGPAYLALKFARVKAPNLQELAQKLGFDQGTFADAINRYNQSAAGQPDPFGKAQSECRPLATGPFYAIDIGTTSKLFPLPVLSLGGLDVDEATGAVLDRTGKAIAGLYAAGRTAVGVCSHLYVSGLSVADCIFSGRRAAASAARDGLVRLDEAPDARASR